MAADDPVVPLAEGIEHDQSQWERATAAVLRKTRRLAEDAPDSDVWSVLTTTTLDGLSITPLGTPDLVADLPEIGLPGEAPYTRGSGTGDPALYGWDIRGWFTDPETSPADLSTELENGANSLWLTVGERGIAADRLAELLEPVFLDLAPVVLDAREDAVAAAEAFLAVCRDKGTDPHPLTNLGATGTDLDTVVRVATLAKEAGVRGVVVDASALHDQGASEVQELAWSMMLAVTYLRALEAAGFTTDEAAAQLEFRYAATDEQFPTIAKLRAARALWNRVGEISGIGAEARAQRQHAVTSRPMMARYDSYTNMLRTTVAGFAAGVGGADAVTVLPFDEPLGLPTAFSRRIARNTSSLLIHESHVAKVVDPAGGAYAVEKFTDDLAMAAWALFSELDGLDELEGVADLDAAADRMRPLVEAVRDDRALQIGRRQRPITGVSEFPNPAETLPERRPYPVEPDVFRYAGEFEQMRDEPAAQPVFLATMGTIAAHTARATFAINLLAAGGIGIGASGATTDVADVVDKYREAGAPPVVCLAGTDAAYGQWGADLVTALRENGASYVIVAGKTDIGQDASAAMGLDALAFLRALREELQK
ncbi:methylmalonyl-CoA mutase family protein [Aeromicrobium duanguangcaii]|uniref:Methylmalonyl-CoA mutase family protein n=1 Tax=Aeromicrobium duanguangcaii TaxID=2968086 RepID=A0ABY5KEB4_9ACTN|nr:methylmalonyl-CoA mutase family protein [Aeromicrobium duanguangcaii]MCD9155231.1 methylmalonyl-CoA mutase family protein [Aeromicrobium duanguangcaii]UUI68118.1 methylmalonyl-CoA mutase family protein [Aeromicrobium duanguangcaii]